MTDFSSAIRLIVAAVAGAAVGVERQWSGHASGAAARFGGIRTFTLLGGAAGMCGLLASAGYGAIAAVLIGAAAALIVAGYIAASRTDVDATTEVAAVVVLCAGLLAGLGNLTLASGAVAVTMLLLVEKTRLHSLVERLDDAELRAAARFAVMAVVVLPLLPTGPFGPMGLLRPRELWLLVLLFAGLSFAGFIARRVVGPAHGYAVAGLLGGLVSSTSVTLTFARLSRTEGRLSRTLGTGAVAACTVLYLRVLLATAILAPAVAWQLVPRLGTAFLVGVAAVTAALVHNAEDGAEAEPSRNPLQFWPALQMAALFQIVLFAVAFARVAFGTPGVLLSGAILGLTDVDALTVSMAKSTAAGVTAATAAEAITIGIIANCALKMGVAALGTSAFRRATGPALAVMALVMVAALRLLHVP